MASPSAPWRKPQQNSDLDAHPLAMRTWHERYPSAIHTTVAQRGSNNATHQAGIGTHQKKNSYRVFGAYYFHRVLRVPRAFENDPDMEYPAHSSSVCIQA